MQKQIALIFVEGGQGGKNGKNVHYRDVFLRLPKLFRLNKERKFFLKIVLEKMFSFNFLQVSLDRK